MNAAASVASSAAPSLGNRVRVAAAGESSRGGGDPRDGLRDPPREEPGDSAASAPPTRAAITSASTNGVQRVSVKFFGRSRMKARLPTGSAAK